MAIEYALDLSDAPEASALLEIAADVLATRPQHAGRTFRAGRLVVAAWPLEERGRTIAKETHGMDVSTRLMFRLDKEDLDKATAELMVCVGALLRRVGGDAALLCNGEWVVLRRDRGRLRVNSTFRDWPPKLLAALGR